MYEDFAPKMAKVITDYSVNIQPGDYVVISGNTLTQPLVEALMVAVLERGGHPHMNCGYPNMGELFLRHASDEQLQYVDPINRLIYNEADVLLNIEAPVNPKALSTVDPQKLALNQKANVELLQTMLKRLTDGSLRWCLMPWPTDAAANLTEMGLHAYTEFLYKACMLHLEDPVAHWEAVRDEQLRLVEWLNGKSHVEVKGPGIELSLDYGGRKWVSAHANLNFPDGEIFTGPIEDSVNGSVEFNLPTYYGGREVNGVKLTYRDGRIVEASAKKNEDYLLSQLDMDEGARVMGEFAIGTNWGINRVTGSTLLDEKLGGTIHMAVGASIPETLGTNESGVHWDMVHDMKQGGQLVVDGELFYKDGKFVV